MSSTKIDKVLCRICVQYVNDGRNIFQNHSGDVLLANILIECTDVEASADDKLPEHICTVCLETLEILNEFRTLVKNSDALLRETTSPSESDPSENQPELLLEDFKAEYLEVDETSPIACENEKEPASEGESLIEYEVVEIDTEVQPTPETDADDQQRFNCCSCKETCTSTESLMSHFATTHPTFASDHDPTPFQCTLCRKHFQNLAALKKHKTHYQNLIACPICGREVMRSLMSQHKSAYHEFQECDVCQKVFKKSGLSEHKEKMHSSLSLSCDQCPKLFTNKIYLKRHIKTVHAPRDPTKLVECKDCKKSFVNQSVLRKHMRIHNGEKPYRCQICGAVFTHNTDHRRHMWTHTGSPHQCQDCHKSFDRPRKLQSHICSRSYK